MKISYDWLNDFVDLKELGPVKTAELLTARGLEVEEVIDLAAGLEKVVTAEVVEKKQHPNADRLNVCKVNNGGSELLDIVCGAQNFKQGDRVALAQVGAELPNGMKIKSGQIRG